MLGLHGGSLPQLPGLAGAAASISWCLWLRALRSQRLENHVALTASALAQGPAPRMPHGADWVPVAGTDFLLAPQQAPAAWPRVTPDCPTATRITAQLGEQISKPALVPSPQSREPLAAVLRSSVSCSTHQQPARLPQPREPRSGRQESALPPAEPCPSAPLLPRVPGEAGAPGARRSCFTS